MGTKDLAFLGPNGAVPPSRNLDFWGQMGPNGPAWARWGRWGQLGHPAEADVYSARPVRVDQLAPRHAVSVACGHHSTIALDSQGEVLAWGFWRGAPPTALEDGPPTHSQSTSRVERLPLPGPACAVHAGGAHAVAVLAENTLWAWGSNSHGQIGNGECDSGDGAASCTGSNQVRTPLPCASDVSITL